MFYNAQKPKRKNALVLKSDWFPVIFIGIWGLLFVAGVAFVIHLDTQEHIHPRDSYELGFQQFQRGNCTNAIEHFSTAIDLQRDFNHAYVMRGECYARLNDHPAAILDFTVAIEINSGFATPLYNRGNSYLAIGEYELAVDDFSAAIEIRPSYNRAYNNLGYSYALLGEWELAIEHYNLALEIQPHGYTYNNRAFANFQLGNMETVFEDYTRSVRIAPNNPDLYRNRGFTYYTLGIDYYEEAIADYNLYARLTGHLTPSMEAQIEEMMIVIDLE